MKTIYLALLTYMSFFAVIGEGCKEISSVYSNVERFEVSVNEVKTIINNNTKYNTKIAFFIDMKIKSGRNRFFVYDLENNQILDQGLVAHGAGSETDVKGNLQFSNLPESKCTSLGSYSIGKCYKGMFGKAYKLYGLEETNSNAFKRSIVLHHYSAIPYEEQDYYISNSRGCPMVNEVFFKRIEKIIDASKSNIILNIFY